MDKLKRLHVNKVVQLHRVSVIIVLDRDLKFTSDFWPSIQHSLGTSLSLSTAFHPRMDGQLKRIIQTLKDVLKAYVLEFSGNQEDHLPLVKFTYNNSYHTTVGMASYEALYRRKCRTSICCEEIGDKRMIGSMLVHVTFEKMRIIRDIMKAA